MTHTTTDAAEARALETKPIDVTAQDRADYAKHLQRGGVPEQVALEAADNCHWRSPLLQTYALRRLATAEAASGAVVTAATATEGQLRRIQLLADVELHLKSCRIFLTSREKMHPCGVDLHDELLAKVTAAIEQEGRNG